MKNEKKHTLRFKAAFLLLLAGWFWIPATGQVEFDDVIKLESGVSPTSEISLTNRTFDTDILTWGNNAVELEITVKLRAKKQEDIDQTLEAIRDIEFRKSGTGVVINTVFWESITSNFNHKIKLKTGKKVVLKDFDLEMTLYIPKTASVKIDNKYADISMEGISGGADIRFHSGKLYAQSFGEPIEFDLRYSKVFMDNAPGAEMELYDSDIEMNACGDLQLNSKYSKVEIENAGDFNFVSYDDNYSIGKVGKIAGEAKYTDFDFGPSINLNFDFYDCNLKGGDTGDVKGSGKYNEIQLGNTGNISLSSSYDDAFIFGKIQSFECDESKYTDFEIASLAGSFELNSYDDNILLEHIEDQFSGIKIQGKYGDYRLNIPKSAQYQLLVDMKYGRLEYPEEQFNRKTYIKENSKLFMDATTLNSGENPSVIEINGHDNRVFIKN